MKWFRLYSEIIDDTKIQELTNLEFKIWIFTLAYASEINQEGSLNSDSLEKISWRFRIKTENIRRTFSKFIALKMIDTDSEGKYYVTNWKSRQYKSDNVTIRVQKHRDMKRYRNVTVTPSEAEADTETDNSITSVMQQVAEIAHPKKDKSYFIDMLKKLQLPGKYALDIVEKNSLEMIARQILLYEYHRNNNKQIKNPVGFLRTLLEFPDKYPLADGFYEYKKKRAEALLKSKDENLKVLGAYL